MQSRLNSPYFSVQLQPWHTVGLLKDGIKPKQLQTDLRLSVNSGHGHRDVSQLRHSVP
jgi:hypothetical protein